ncbi:hypothetical protein [Kibdelosporangium aridum]|uniref:hypothetical protein n=1 Tax=Kibdelosporangium aridum TaxID=2030 RepID=UPI00052729DA
MKKWIGPVIAGSVLVLTTANFFRLYASDPGTEPWLADSLEVTHPIGMIALAYLGFRMLDVIRLPYSRWLTPIGYRQHEDPEESITLQNPPAAPRDHEKRDQEGP